MHMSEIKRDVLLDVEMGHYRNCFDAKWAQRLEALTLPAPNLNRLAFDLSMGWRAAAFTSTIPLTMIEQVDAFYRGYVTSGADERFLSRVLKDLPGKIVAQDNFGPSVVRKLRKCITKTAIEAQEAYREATASAMFPVQKCGTST
jgi:hypothetical protein